MSVVSQPEPMTDSASPSAQFGPASMLGTSCPAPELPEWVAGLRHVPQLTQRESDVFALLADGRSNRDISAALLIAERTVKKHVGSIIAKLEVDSRLQVGLVALTYQLAAAASRDGRTTDPSLRYVRLT